MPKCSECNVKFEEEEELRNHLEKDHGLPRGFFKVEEGCETCSKSDLPVVKIEADTTKKYEISVKNEDCETVKEIVNESEDEVDELDEDDSDGQKGTTRKRSIRLNTGISMIKIEEEDDGTWHCPDCHQVYITTKGLRLHFRLKHRQALSNCAPIKLSCNLCDLLLDTRTLLKCDGHGRKW